jgi:hypothetical protein
MAGKISKMLIAKASYAGNGGAAGAGGAAAAPVQDVHNLVAAQQKMH